MAQRIDREIDQQLAAAKIPASAPADDAEFCRRIHLDITGRIPSSDRLVAFLESQEPDKRRRLIDELLASPEYGKHFGKIWFELIVRDRLANNHKKFAPAFREALAKSFNDDHGWDRIVTEILTAQGTAQENPRVVYFLANLEMGQPAPEKITAMTAQLFLGLPLQCAQCHRHPFVKKWQRTDFWGMAAFFSHIRDDGDVGVNGNTSYKQALITEGEGRPKGTLGFRMYYPTPLAGAAIPIPDAHDPTKNLQVAKARFFEGEEPALGEQVPFRPRLAAWLTSADNKYFARAAVNRLWAHFFARGLVNPIDAMSEANQPSHPVLLSGLTREFTASGFDLKYTIRCMCNSRAYQRTSRPLPANAKDVELYSHMAIKAMSPHVLLNSLGTATGKKQALPAYVRDDFDSLFGTSKDDAPTQLSYGMPHYLRLLNLYKGGSAAFGSLLSGAMKPGAAPDKVIEGLYLAILSRRPTAAETQTMAQHVARQKDAKAGYADVAAALLNSAEFILNH